MDAVRLGVDRIENFEQFFKEPALTNGLRNTIIYAAVTSSLKVVLGLLLAVLLTSRIRARGLLRSMVFFPCSSARSRSA